MLTNLFILIIACIFLAITSGILTRSLTRVAIYLKITEFVIGFIIVAVVTALPDLFVGVISALNHNPELGLGNVIGGNIIDLTLVIGVLALLRRGIVIDTKTVRTDTLYMFIIITIPILLMLDQELSRLDGGILLVVFFTYIFRLFTQEKRFREVLNLNSILKKEFLWNIGISITSAVILFLLAWVVIENASILATSLMIPPILIGLFIISLGTTLPELVFDVTAIMKRHNYMALGDLIGSVIANSSMVLGIMALIYPIRVDIILFLSSSFFMLTVAFLFTTFVVAEKHILWQEGIALILLYILFIIVEFNIRIIGSNIV